MARSFNNSRNSNSWTPDRKAKRAIRGKETRTARKNERRDIERSMRSDSNMQYGF